MEITALPGFAPAPQVEPDTRPTADAAALARDATPDTPLPVPPTPTQQALVGQAALRTATSDTAPGPGTPTTGAERRLKPYGITMLPERAEGMGPGR